MKIVYYALTLSLYGLAAWARPDLAVLSMTGPATSAVNIAGQYDIEVKNTGDVQQRSSVLTVYLPMHAQVSNLTTGCSVSAKYLLTCNWGNVAAGTTKNVSFLMTQPAPVSSWQLLAKVTGADLEPAISNNTKTIVFTATAPAQNHITIVGPRPARMEACAFLNGATPDFSLCSSSSVIGYDLTLDANGIVRMGTSTGNAGSWEQQGTSPDENFHAVMSNGNVIYDGHSISPSCFEGVVTFLTSTNKSAFRICLR